MANTEPKPGTSSQTPSSSVPVKPIPSTRAGRIFYPPTDRHRNILDSLSEQRKDGEFCDIQIKVSTLKSVYAHKSLLVASSPYFMGMFTSSFMEATSDSIDLSHMTGSSDILEKVIDSFYGKSFEIIPENVGEVINLASMLLLDELKELCSKVMTGMVSIKNVPEFLNLALEFNLNSLKEKLTPIVGSRFHDYIMFQEELCEFSIETFTFIISIVNVENVSRKAEFLNMVFKWFYQCETDERAKALIVILERLRVKPDHKVYRDIENSVDSIVEHLGDANADVAEETGKELRKALEALRPDDYAVNHVDEAAIVLEEEPEKRKLPNRYVQAHGPYTKDQGYTEREEQAYKNLHEEMKQQRIYDYWAEKERKNPDAKWEPGDPPRPEFIYLGPLLDAHKTRKFRTKTPDELEEGLRLIDSVVVLSSRRGLPGQSGADFDIVAYIPRRKAWFQLGSLSAYDVQKFGLSTTFSSASQSRPRRSYSYDFDFDYDDDDDFDEFSYMAMRGMHDLDFGGRMMGRKMRDMPRHQKRKLMAMIMSKGHLSSSEMKRMMRDIDDDDMPPHMQDCLMRYLEMEHRGRRLENRRERRSLYRPTTTSGVPNLTDEKWKCVYLRHKLYFCHDKFCEAVFSFDLSTKVWKKTGFNIVSPDIRREHVEVADGISLLVMGQTLYAVVRILDLDVEPKYSSKEKYMKEQEVDVFHKIFKFDDSRQCWQLVLKTDSHHVSILRSKTIDMQKFLNEGVDMGKLLPHYCQAGIFKTSFFIEDEEKLNIFILREVDKDQKTYKVDHLVIVYLDLKRSENIYCYMNTTFVRDPMPLLDDDIVVILNDHLQPVMRLDMRITKTRDKIVQLCNPSPKQKFAEGLAVESQSTVISTGDGRRAWVLRGTPDNRSELLEVTASCDYLTSRKELNYTFHPPPPMKQFTMATTAKMDTNLMPSLALPTKYLHG